jgi:hypothetical protein
MLIHTVDQDLAPATPEQQSEAMDSLYFWLAELHRSGDPRRLGTC